MVLGAGDKSSWHHGFVLQWMYKGREVRSHGRVRIVKGSTEKGDGGGGGVGRVRWEWV